MPVGPAGFGGFKNPSRVRQDTVFFQGQKIENSALGISARNTKLPLAWSSMVEIGAGCHRELVI
jgi:hypothetical protein